MEFAYSGRATAVVADDVDDSRPHRFPDPPPPLPLDLLAAQKREALIWELHKERTRRDMISRQLADTERAMAASFGHPDHWPLPPSQEDYWQHRRPPPLPPVPWDEAAPRPPPAETDHPPGFPFPWSYGAVRPPPVYPHVERSPSPPPAADGGDQQQELRSPAAAVRPMLSGDLEGCPSPSKRSRTLPEAALVPEAANAGAGMMMSALSVEEVTPKDQWAADREEPKHVVEDGHSVQPLHQTDIVGKNQCTEQTKIVESTMKCQSDELLARQCQYRPTSEPAPQAEWLKRKLTTATSPLFPKKLKKHKSRVKWTCGLCLVTMPSPRSLVVHFAGKLHRQMLSRGESVAESGGPWSLPAGDEGLASSKRTCRICNARCVPASVHEHLGGRRHRANVKAVLAIFRSSYSTLKNDGSDDGKSEFYCNTCDVRCTGEVTLASHLVERRHRLDWRREE